MTDQRALPLKVAAEELSSLLQEHAQLVATSAHRSDFHDQVNAMNALIESALHRWNFAVLETSDTLALSLTDQQLMTFDEPINSSEISAASDYSELYVTVSNSETFAVEDFERLTNGRGESVDPEILESLDSGDLQYAAALALRADIDSSTVPDGVRRIFSARTFAVSTSPPGYNEETELAELDSEPRIVEYWWD